MLDEGNSHLLAFARLSRDQRTRLAIICNMHHHAIQRAGTRLETTKKRVVNLLTGKKIAVREGVLHADLAPGECLVFEY